MKTKDQIKEHLEKGGRVTVQCWSFTKGHMNCENDNCCEDCFSSVDEAVESVIFFSNGNLSNVDFLD